MAEYRTVRMAFWHDPFIEELDAKAKLLYLYLFTCPYANNLGVVEATRKKISFETSLTSAEVDKCLAEFESAGKVVIDQSHNLVFLCNFIRHQCSTSPKLMEGLKKIAPEVSSPIIAKAICIRYPDVYGLNKDDGDTVSIPYANGIHTLCIPSGEVGSWKLEVGTLKEDTNVSLSAKDTDAVLTCDYDSGETAPDTCPNCPHQRIVEMYHEALPMLPRVKTWQGTRPKNLGARWRETWERLRKKGEPHDLEALLAWWKGYFAQARASPCILGQRLIQGRPFFADLGWLVKPENYAKVLEGKYLERPQHTRAA